MIRIGLTGSICMGKSVAAKMIREQGIPVFDADAAVHRLLGSSGDAVEPVGAAFPGVVHDGAVDRARLGQAVFGDDEALKRLESILHPLVARERRRFLAQARRRRQRLAVLDVPLLFETGGDAGLDAVLVVSCPAFLQAQRVMKRPNMTRSRLKEILRLQMSDWEKRRRAHAVLLSGLGRRFALARIRSVLAAIRDGAMPGKRGRRRLKNA